MSVLSQLNLPGHDQEENLRRVEIIKALILSDIRQSLNLSATTILTNEIIGRAFGNPVLEIMQMFGDFTANRYDSLAGVEPVKPSDALKGIRAHVFDFSDYVSHLRPSNFSRCFGDEEENSEIELRLHEGLAPYDKEYDKRHIRARHRYGWRWVFKWDYDLMSGIQRYAEYIVVAELVWRAMHVLIGIRPMNGLEEGVKFHHVINKYLGYDLPDHFYQSLEFYAF